VLGCAGLAGVAFLLIAAPVDILRDRVIEQVKARTGRDLVIGGPVSLSVFPRPAVSLGDVSLSAPEGMEGAPTLVAPALDVELRPWSLLLWQVAVERLTLHRPTIELGTDAQGRRSWEFPGRERLRPTAHDAGPSEQVAPAPVASESQAAAALAKLGLASIRVVDATVRYRDESTESQHEIKSLDLALTADDTADRLDIEGTLAWRGAPLSFAGAISPLRPFLQDQPAKLQLKVAGAPVEIVYDGSLAKAGDTILDGKVSIRAPSVQALRLGTAPPAGADSGPLAVSMQVTAGRSQVALSQLEGMLGDARLDGSLTIDTSQKRPGVSGNLKVSELDIGRVLLRPSGQGPAEGPPAPSSAQEAPAPAAASTQPTPAPATAPAPGRAKSGWSEEPIDLPVLGVVNANLALSVGRLVYKELKTGPSRLSVALKNGVAKVGLDEIELYGGRGRGELTLDGGGEVLRTASNLKLTNVSVSPLIADALGFRWLDGGRGNVTLALTGQGLSERQIVETLNGKVDVAVANGTVTGVDIGKIVRAIQQGRLPNLSPAPEDRTPFSELSGTFEIANGTAKSQNLRLVSAHLQLAGEGTLQLGPRQVDYTVQAKIVGGPPAPDAVINVGSLEISIGIAGPWDKPAFSIKGQERLTGAVKQIGKNLRSQEVQEAIKGLLRGDPEQPRPRELLEKLLK
jgi:AsmA protein